jgi:hypothetical protein
MSAANAYNAVSYDEAERTLISRLEEGITNYRLNRIKLETHGSISGDIGSPYGFVAYGYMTNVRAGRGSQSPKKKEYDDKFKEEYVKRLLYEKMDTEYGYYELMDELNREYVQQYLDVLDAERAKQTRPTPAPASTSQSRPAPTSMSTSASSTLPKFYRRLQVPINANTNTITKHYRRLALKYHPDKGGNTAKFQKLQEAYSTLKNTTKRQTYNRSQGIRRGGRRRFPRTSKRRD